MAFITDTAPPEEEEGKKGKKDRSSKAGKKGKGDDGESLREIAVTYDSEISESNTT